MPLAKPHSSGDPSTTSQHDLANSPSDVTTRYLQAASLPNDDRTPPQPDSQPESLKDQATHILDEARTVLPGIQALFGFQLMAVFSDRFATGLTEAEQRLHFASIVLVVLAIGLMMTPAAYHRQIDDKGAQLLFVRQLDSRPFWRLHDDPKSTIRVPRWQFDQRRKGHFNGLPERAAV